MALEALDSLTGVDSNNNEDSTAAKDICQLLGGLPLAIVQMSGFICDRGYSYEEFLPIYRKSAAKIHAREERPVEYNHTLSTVWDLSLQNLPQDASILQIFTAFFDPDKIEERLLTNPKVSPPDDRFDFLTDEFECEKPPPMFLFLIPDSLQLWRSRESAYKILARDSLLGQQSSIGSSISSSRYVQSPPESGCIVMN